MGRSAQPNEYKPIAGEKRGTADGSSTRHCPWAPMSGGVGGMIFVVGGGGGARGAGTVSPHVVMSGISVCGQGDQKKNDSGSGLRVRTCV